VDRRRREAGKDCRERTDEEKLDQRVTVGPQQSDAAAVPAVAY
jgi:hypothetical protein